MPCTVDAPTGELVRVAAGPAPDVEDPLPGSQTERLDDVVDLLHRPLGERVAQVRLTEMRRDRLEPVLAPWRHAFASAQVVPQATLTSSGTSSCTASRMISITSGPTTSFSSTGASTSTSSCTWRTSRLW